MRAPQYKKGIEVLESVQKVKLVKGLEGKRSG